MYAWTSILITGGSSGGMAIGPPIQRPLPPAAQALPEMLLEDGLQVWGTARDPKRLPSRQGFHAVALELGLVVHVQRARARAGRRTGCAAPAPR